MEQSIGVTELRQRLPDILQSVREQRETYLVETFGRYRAAIINTVLSSSATRDELAKVLARPTIQQLAVASLDELVYGLEHFSEHVPVGLELSGACRDPKDDMFLACAVEGKAHYIVSSDRDFSTFA